MAKKMYLVFWEPTERYEPQLETRRESSLMTESLAVATEAYKKELAETSLTKLADINFNPSDKEFSTNVTWLSIVVGEWDEEEGFQEDEGILTSELYWIEL